MKISLSCLYETKVGEFVYPFHVTDELFAIAKEVGFDGVEYIATIPDLYRKPQQVVSLSKQYEVPVLSVHAPMHLLIYTPSFLLKPLMNMFQSFPDANVFNFHLSGFITPMRKNEGTMKKFMSVTKENNIEMSFESNPLLSGLGRYPKVTYDPETFAQYCIKNNMSITFDTAHIAHCNYDIVTFFKKYHKHISLIHLSDSIGDLQHLPLGKGNLPIRKLLQELKSRKYDKSITFEINKFDNGATRKDKVEVIKRSFDLVTQYAT